MALTIPSPHGDPGGAAMAAGAFAGRTALVTGGGSGIGRACALALAAGGAAVVVGDIAEDAGQAVADGIAAAGGRAAFRRCDAADEADVAALVAAATDAFGGLDLAVNNVGFSWGAGVEEMTGDEWDRTVNLCLKAPWLGLKHELPAMVARGGGAVVNIASMAGVIHAPTANIAYSAAKAGVIHMTRYAAVAYADRNIRVNCVSPGLTRTAAVERFLSREQQDALAAQAQPIGRAVEPAEIADAVAWLLSDRSAMVTGENICVAGGHQAR